MNFYLGQRDSLPPLLVALFDRDDAAIEAETGGRDWLAMLAHDQRVIAATPPPERTVPLDEAVAMEWAIVEACAEAQLPTPEQFWHDVERRRSSLPVRQTTETLETWGKREYRAARAREAEVAFVSALMAAGQTEYIAVSIPDPDESGWRWRGKRAIGQFLESWADDGSHEVWGIVPLPDSFTATATVIEPDSAPEDALIYELTLSAPMHAELPPTGPMPYSVSRVSVRHAGGGPVSLRGLDRRIVAWSEQAIAQVVLKVNGRPFKDPGNRTSTSQLSPRKRRADAAGEQLLSVVRRLHRQGVPVNEIRLAAEVVRLHGGKEPSRSSVYRWISEEPS